MKVGKEEIMGLLAAVEAWKKMDIEPLAREWAGKSNASRGWWRRFPESRRRFRPRCRSVIVRAMDQAAIKLTVAECARKLVEGEPRIEVATRDNPSAVPGAKEGDPKSPRDTTPDRNQIVFTTLQPSEELLVARRLREVLLEARKSG
jgi:hypothetical protein